jgi:iron complex transport system substrate-binding protein
MKKLIMFTIALVALANVYADEPYRVQDETGNIIDLPKSAQRIISLAPHITEMLFAIGAGQQIVGVVSYSNYPEEAKQILNIGGYNKLDIEAIVALQPDLIIAWQGGNSKNDIEQLIKLGLPVYINEQRKLLDIPETLINLGTLTGHRQQAENLATGLRARNRQQRERYRNSRKITVFYQIWADPLMTLNGEHIFSDLLQSCGAVNVFADLPSLHPRINLEAVLSRDPEVIIVSGMGEARPEWLDIWRQWPQLKAVKGDNLYYIHPDLLQRSGPRLFDGQEQLCDFIEQARQKGG